MNETERGIARACKIGKYEAWLDIMSEILLKGELDEYSKSIAKKVRKELADNGVYSEYGFAARQHGDVQILESKDNGGV